MRRASIGIRHGGCWPGWPMSTTRPACRIRRCGTAGIFACTGRAWHLTGPALPAACTHQAITVLRLTTSAADTTVALLAADATQAASEPAAWSTGGAHWALPPPLPLHGAKLHLSIVWARRSHSGRAEPGPRTGHHRPRNWQSLPALPPGTATLAPMPPAGGTPRPSTTPGRPSGTPGQERANRPVRRPSRSPSSPAPLAEGSVPA
jgi:hypothetical protein